MIPFTALLLGIGFLVVGLASAQDAAPEYLNCRFQEQTSPFAVTLYSPRRRRSEPSSALTWISETP